MAYNKTLPAGQAAMAASNPVVIASNQSAVPVSFTGSTDVATQTTLSALNAKFVSGTDIGDVTINNTTSTPVPVSPPLSGFLNVSIDQTGNNNAVDVLTLPANASVNVAQINGVTPLMGNGVTGTGSQRVTIASDNTAFPVNATLSAETTKVIGTVNLNKVMGEDLLIGNGVTGNGSPRVTIASNNTPFAIKTDLTTPGTTNKVSLGADVVHTIVDSGALTETNSAAIKTGVELIDDAIFTDDTSTHATGTTKGIGIMAAANPTDAAVDANDIGMIAMTLARALKIDTTSIAGTGTATGNGTASAGCQRVTIASDNTAFPVKVASGGIASGAIASGAIASGAIAAGAIAAGNTSIATTEDTARAAGEHLVKIGLSRLDVPVANANVSTDGDYTNFICDNFGKLWVSGSVQEDVAHVAGEALSAGGVRRIDTPATSAGSSGDWATMDASAEGALWSTLTPTTTGGLSVGNFTGGDTYTALTNSAQVIKASAGNLYGYYMYNPNATVAYVMIYNIAAASVTVGTSTAQMVFAIPAGAAANVNFPYPITFSNAGWSIAAATTAAGNTAPTTALDVMVYYK
jgi:hypothetical protein